MRAIRMMIVIGLVLLLVGAASARTFYVHRDVRPAQYDPHPITVTHAAKDYTTDVSAPVTKAAVRSVSSTPTASPIVESTPATTVAINAVTRALSAPSAASRSANSFVTVQGTEFYLDGQPWHFAGGNMYYLWMGNWECGVYDTHQGCSREVLDDAKALGLNVVRVWGFSDDGNYWGTLQWQPGVYNEADWVRFDRMLKEVGDLNMKVIIPFVNNWFDFGGMCTYTRWCNASVSCNSTVHDSFFTDSCTRDIYKNYVNFVLNRTNTLTGVKYKDDPTILAWELANEPRADSDPTNTIIDNWIEEMSTYIKSIDGNHLVTTGLEGFTNQHGTDFVKNSNHTNIDFADYHLLVNNWGFNEQMGVNWINSHLDDAAKIGKPVILEEIGVMQTQRDAWYDSFFNVLESRNGNGDLIWMLRDDKYPDWDYYGVNCPNDSTTCALLAHHASIMNTNDGRIVCSSNADCGTDGWASMPVCSGDNVSQLWYEWTCSDPGTTTSACSVVQTVKVKDACPGTCYQNACVAVACKVNSDCGTSGFINTPACSNNDVYDKIGTYTCYNPGTKNAICEYESWQWALKEDCAVRCVNNACAPAVCTTNADCGTSTSGTPYCNGNAVYRQQQTFTCNNPGTASASCGNSNQVVLVQQCAALCSNGACVTPACTKASDCGTSGLVGANYCISNAVYKKYRTYSCANPGTVNALCGSGDQDSLIQQCADTCTNGACDPITPPVTPPIVPPVECTSDTQCGTDKTCMNNMCTVPAYRLFHGLAVDHFYTTSAPERDFAKNTIGFGYEGIQFHCYADQKSGTVPFFRLYYGAAAQDHFYTADANEKIFAVTKIGFNDEGVLCYIYPSQTTGTVPLYRLYIGGTAQDHFYTTSAAEKDNAAANNGYTYEGVSGYVFP